jgi:hypothetical protein
VKAEYIGADQLPFFFLRLQLCGGPYISDKRRDPEEGRLACRQVSLGTLAVQRYLSVAHNQPGFPEPSGKTRNNNQSLILVTRASISL